MPLFVFHFSMYDLAKKRPIGGHICLTYCLYMQLAALAADLVISLWMLLQHYADRRGTGFAPWVPWGFADWLRIFLGMAALVAPIMLLVSLIPYHYIKRESEKAEEEKARKEKNCAGREANAG